jgi:hypothetical protein
MHCLVSFTIPIAYFLSSGDVRERGELRVPAGLQQRPVLGHHPLLVQVPGRGGASQCQHVSCPPPPPSGLAKNYLL